MTEQECRKRILETLKQFEKDNNVHITSVTVPTRHSISIHSRKYEILEPRIEYEQD